jgi:poly(glycerol-phosphate) alpha-glucosyltransferase
MSVYALYVIKIQQIPGFLDNKRIAKSTKWNLDHLLMEMPLTVQNPMKNSKNKYGHIACFIGRLKPNKGVADLIYSWKLVIKSIPDAKLYIIGADVSRGEYQKLINKLNINNSIKITGYLLESDKNHIISMSSLSVFPSYEEGWSLAVMESINSGLLPILYDIPAYDYICNDEVKVTPGNIDKLSNKIVYFFENQEKAEVIVKKLQICNKKYSKDYVFDLWFNQILEKFNLI